MSDYDICLNIVKRASYDVGRKLRFYDDPAGTTPAVVKDFNGNVLTQPIKVPADGHLNVRFDQWPVYYADNRQWSRIKRVPGMPATVGAAVGDPITSQNNIAGLGASNDLSPIGATGDLDETVVKTDIDDNGNIDGTEIAAMLSADHARINSIRATVDTTAARVNAVRSKLDAVIAALVSAGVLRPGS